MEDSVSANMSSTASNQDDHEYSLSSVSHHEDRRLPTPPETEPERELFEEEKYERAPMRLKMASDA